MTQEPQRQNRNLTPIGLLLAGLIGLFTIGVVVALLWENGLLPLKIRGLSAEACASLSVALTGVWVTLRTFTQSLTPYLIYRSRPDDTSQMLSRAKEKVWRIELMNTGSGMAVFQKITFRCGNNAKPLNLPDFEEILKTKRLFSGRDYQFQVLSKGTALPPQGTLLLAEIAYKKRFHFQFVHITLDYENTLGKKYQKIVQVSPHNES